MQAVEPAARLVDTLLDKVSYPDLFIEQIFVFEWIM
jgi:hypothetical protein